MTLQQTSKQLSAFISQAQSRHRSRKTAQRKRVLVNALIIARELQRKGTAHYSRKQLNALRGVA